MRRGSTTGLSGSEGGAGALGGTVPRAVGARIMVTGMGPHQLTPGNMATGTSRQTVLPWRPAAIVMGLRMGGLRLGLGRLGKSLTDVARAARVAATATAGSPSGRVPRVTLGHGNLMMPAPRDPLGSLGITNRLRRVPGRGSLRRLLSPLHLRSRRRPRRQNPRSRLRTDLRRRSCRRHQPGRSL